MRCSRRRPGCGPSVTRRSLAGRPASPFADARDRADFDRRLLGSFLEHLGRAIYTGIYEPGSRLSDAKGFRTDVAREIKELGVPIVRYPGGNFISGYNWLDGVGPKAQRPTVLDRAWNSTETNQFGTNDFIDWCRLTGAEPLLGLNFGTGSAEMAVAYVEYCNLERGTKWSDLRRAHGYEQPHNVRYWCLGNEMDGPWQIGQLQAREYGRKARDVAKQMRVVSPDLRLIACGSSAPSMPTYLTWDREVLEECYDQVDGISLHAYYGNTPATSGNSTARYLAMNLDMDRHIHEIAAVCDYVQGLQKSSKRLWLSFDEWNVWYRARDRQATDGRRAIAPHLLEEVYNLEDALLVGGLLNTLLRNSDRVHVACLAQLVNVIAPLVAHENGVLRQSTYYPYAWALHHARGRVLDLRVESEAYPIKGAGLQADFARNSDVPFVDIVATLDEPNGQACVLMLNRDLEAARQVVLEWEDVTPTRVLGCDTITGTDLKAFNTIEQPNRVTPQPLSPPAAGSRMTFELPARSYTVARLALPCGSVHANRDLERARRQPRPVDERTRRRAAPRVAHARGVARVRQHDRRAFDTSVGPAARSLGRAAQLESARTTAADRQRPRDVARSRRPRRTRAAWRARPLDPTAQCARRRSDDAPRSPADVRRLACWSGADWPGSPMSSVTAMAVCASASAGLPLRFAQIGPGRSSGLRRNGAVTGQLHEEERQFGAVEPSSPLPHHREQRRRVGVGIVDVRLALIPDPARKV